MSAMNSKPKAANRQQAKRGRPSSARAAAIDAAIPAAAIELFLEHGFEAVTMDMISIRARISKRTLYTRFASKTDLLGAAVRFQVRSWVDRETEQFRHLPDRLEERLRHHAHLIVSSQSWDEVRRLSRLIGSVSAVYPEITPIIYETGLESVIGRIASDLKEASSSEGLAQADWPFLAQTFFHAIFGWHSSMTLIRTVSEEEVSDYCNKVVSLILASASHHSK